MIVIYRWNTVKEVRMGAYVKKKTHWIGVFLFGFIPLVIYAKDILYV